MRTAASWFAAGLLLLAIPATSHAADPMQLQKSVRLLENLQDGTAEGNLEAARLQRRLINQIEADIMLTPDEVLKRPHNLEAMVTVLLSGGNPNVIEAHTVNLEIDEGMRNLLTGALAYARADRDGAITWLNKVDIQHLPPTLGGRVALVRSIIGASENTVKAIDDLYIARQLAPGTLVEEAALRRCVAFAAKLSDLERLRFCAGRYIRRFPRSLYWDEFADGFADAVAQTGYGEGDNYAELLESFQRLPTGTARELILRLSRACLTHGRFQLAEALADRAAYYSVAASPEMQRARLYKAAVIIASPEPKIDRDLIDRVDATKLPDNDKQLLAKVMALRADVTGEPTYSDDEAKMIIFGKAKVPASEAVEAAMASAHAELEKSRKLAQQPAFSEVSQ